MRLVSWNMAHRSSNWAELQRLVQDAEIDLALLQEAPPPAADLSLQTHPHSRDQEWAITVPRGPQRPWRSAVAWSPDLEELVEPLPSVALADSRHGEPGVLAVSHPGQWAAVMVRSPEQRRDLAVVSLYGIWDSMGSGRAIYAEATLHRAISDLTPLLQRPRTDVVLAGDLNVYRKWQSGSPEADRLWADRYDSVFDRLAAYGLSYRGPLRDGAMPRQPCRCGRGQECLHVNTYRTSAGNLFQLDYLLASRGVEVTRCAPSEPLASTDPSARAWTASDHLPVVIELELAR